MVHAGKRKCHTRREHLVFCATQHYTVKQLPVVTADPGDNLGESNRPQQPAPEHDQDAPRALQWRTTCYTQHPCLKSSCAPPINRAYQQALIQFTSLELNTSSMVVANERSPSFFFLSCGPKVKSRSRTCRASHTSSRKEVVAGGGRRLTPNAVCLAAASTPPSLVMMPVVQELHSCAASTVPSCLQLVRARSVLLTSYAKEGVRAYMQREACWEDGALIAVFWQHISLSWVPDGCCMKP